ncbi:MAG: M12 family metallopeptidase [Bdellovibrionales bacterium]
MKRPGILLVIAGLIWAVFWWKNPLPPAPKPTPVALHPEKEDSGQEHPSALLATRPTSEPTEGAARPTPPPVKKPSSPSHRRHHNRLPPQASPRRPSQPPAGAVPYELKNGLAVAYGDVILGRPKSPDLPRSGFMQAPVVSPWQSSEIAFSIDPALPNPDRVLQALEYFNTYTPIRFVPFTGQSEGIHFTPTSEHCLSYLGQIGGHQPIYLSAGCREREILHEILHALGFMHEHSRPDRDQYIAVEWEKIQEDKWTQFEIIPDSWASAVRRRPFDYRSVMMYAETSFAKRRGDITLRTLTNTAIEPTQEGLSREDLDRLFQVYAR